MNNRLINVKVAGGCTDIVDNYDPFGGNGVALYQLNGNANDVSGNYNGTATNVTYGTGQFGQAGVFNGSSSRVAIPNIVNQAADHTVSIWIKPTDFNTGIGKAAVSMFNGSHCLVYIQQDAGLNTTGDYNISAGSTAGTLTANVWNHIALTYNYATTTYTMYVNGVNRGVDVNFNFSGRPNSIGCHNNNASFDSFFNGSIDQVRIFNTELTPLEVEALYTEELCICDGTVDTLDILGDGSCIATYQLDGNANDLSGNYSGTPTNVSYGVGEFDLAGSFNGTNSSYIDLSALDSFFYNNGNFVNFTTSIWFKSSDNVSYIFTDYNGSFKCEITLNSFGNVSVVTRYGATDVSFLSTSTYNDNNWHHITVTGETATLQRKVYIDNTLLSTMTVAASGYTQASGDNRTSFGVLYAAGNTYGGYAGSIDQVRIFNKALSAGEVTTLYNETPCN